MKEVIAGVPLAQFAAVTAALAEAFPLRAVLAIEGLDAARWAEADRGWTEQLDEDPALLARYEAELDAARDRLHSREDAAPDKPQDEGAGRPAPSRDGKARLVRSGTGLAAPPPAAPIAFSSPVAFPAAPYHPEPAPPHPPVAMPPHGLDEESTRPAFKVPAEFLPFRNAPDPPPVASTPAHPESPWAGGDDRGTLVAFELPSEVLPFRALPVPTGAPASEEPPQSSDDESTQVAFKVPAAFLPFQDTPSRSFQEALEAPAAAPGDGSDGRTVAVVGAVAALRALPLGESRDLPWAAPAPPPPAPRPPPPPAPPRARGALPAPLPPPPKPRPPPPRPSAPVEPPLSLERHASLCLELAVDPAHAGEALARYQVSAADKARADEYYRARIAADPDLRAQWNHAYAVYHAWYTSRPRP